MGQVLAIDIGGTKLAVGRVSTEGELLERWQCPTPWTTEPEELFTALTDLIGRAGDTAAFELCGVGVGGPMSKGGAAVSPLNIPAWRGFPLRQRLESLTALPVRVDNDAKALALAEGWRGAARGVDNYIAMVVSTGVGGGIVVDGKLLNGTTGNAGHIGHIVVEPGGRSCVCGSAGCLEAEASGRAIESITGVRASEADASVRTRTGTLVGRAVASVVSLLDVELATVAGSVALGFGEPFFAAVQAELERVATIEYACRARIVRAELGDEAPLIGAAAVGYTNLS